MIDCHAHLACEAFDADRAAVVDRARASGLEAVIVVSEDAADSQKTLDVCGVWADFLLPAVGLHPDRFADHRPVPSTDEIEAVVELARRHRTSWVALGEVGLDYWVAKDPGRRQLQREFLERMVALSLELDLPLNVHARSAGHHTLELLRAAGAQRVLMHAFDGKAGHAQRAAEELGYTFSVPPEVVRSAQKQKLVRALPLTFLALESDSPVLGPDPKTRNEPANLTLTLEAIATLKRCDVDTVRQATASNARSLFALPAAPGQP